MRTFLSISSAPIVVLAALSAFAFGDRDEIGSAIDKLSSPRAAERAQAERFLSRHLTPDQFERVVTALSGGDAEVRARMTEALAAEDANLEIAVRLAISAVPEAAQVGREAIESMIERWNPGSFGAWMARDELRKALTEQFETRVVMRIEPITEVGTRVGPSARPGASGIEDAIDLCVRCIPRSPAIAIEPELLGAPDPRSKAGAIDALSGDAIFDLAGLVHADVAGFGFGGEGNERPSPWLVIRRRDSEHLRAGELLRAWLLTSASDSTVDSKPDPASSNGERVAADVRRSRAACALAASGWPAGIAWLAERWCVSTDSDARSSARQSLSELSALPLLDGVLLAARRGQVVPRFFEPDVQQRLRAVRDAELARSNPAADQRAAAIALALGATGVSGPRGEDLVAPALAGLESSDARALWLTLVELEGRRSSSPAAGAALDRVLARDELAPALRVQALRARRSAPGAPSAPSAPSPIARPAEMIAWCAERDAVVARDAAAEPDSIASHSALDELDALILPFPCWPPAAWRDPHALPFAGQAAPGASVILGWLERGETAVAAEHLVAVLARASEPEREHLAERLQAATRRGAHEHLVALFTRALEMPGVDAATVARSAALSGAATSASLAARALDSVVPSVGERREDLLVLASLVTVATAPGTTDARTRLIAAIAGEASIDDKLAALQRAIVELRAARDVRTERDFVSRVRLAVRDAPPALRSRLRADHWPPAAVGPALRLADFDRNLAAAGL